ncbi:endonuclease III-like protein 1 [Achroia grisella]|uniref:endonuclease III-like protein 1 n=1 Tax=Achroia grisella TaxID=688607 RepID=UPI0027D32D65|nr:endonuclease III-like protein 1 [Achroia grisella]
MPRGKTKSIVHTKQAKLSKSTIDSREKMNQISVKKEVEEESEPLQESSSSISVPDLSHFKFEKKPHIKIEYEKDSPVKDETKGLWEPPNWREFLVNLRIMRSNYDAPVDTMGCDMSMDENAPPEVYRYQSLISLMLSSQTKDQVTFGAMLRLREKGLTVDNILNMSEEELGRLIYPVSFWKTKIKYIKKTTQILKDQYNSDIPDSVEKLCKLSGVGPKMAHICMKVAWNKITGIGVDTHVHRISNRIGWVRKPTTTPEDTRKALETWVPFESWRELNGLMVGFGQTICVPISPKCDECLNRDICPSSGKGRKSPKKRTPVKHNSNEDEEVNLKPKKEHSIKKEMLTKAEKNDKTVLGIDQCKEKSVKMKKNLNFNTDELGDIKVDKPNIKIEPAECHLQNKNEYLKDSTRTKKVSKKNTTTDSLHDVDMKNSKIIEQSALNIDKKKLSLKRKSPKSKIDQHLNEKTELHGKKTKSTTRN